MSEVQLPDRIATRRHRSYEPCHELTASAKSHHHGPVQKPGSDPLDLLGLLSYRSILSNPTLYRWISPKYGYHLPIFNEQSVQMGKAKTSTARSDPQDVPSFENCARNLRTDKTKNTLKHVFAKPDARRRPPKRYDSGRVWTTSAKLSESHEKRTAELKVSLGDLLNEDISADYSCVLLCRDMPDFCRIVPVQIPNSFSDSAMWERLNQEWYRNMGYWRKYVPFFKVHKVEIVEVRFQID